MTSFLVHVFIVGFENADITGPVLANRFGGTSVANGLIAKTAVVPRIGQREVLLTPIAMVGLFEVLRVGNPFDASSIVQSEAAIDVPGQCENAV